MFFVFVWRKGSFVSQSGFHREERKVRKDLRWSFFAFFAFFAVQ
jgi:hypothetical protein